MFWYYLAKFLARPAVTDWLIKRAMRTPYTHIIGLDGSVYMERYWLFNPYPDGSSGARKRWQFPISIRLHRIVHEDIDRHLHDHPWNARTFILRGYYVEERLLKMDCKFEGTLQQTFVRRKGNTVSLKFGEYHRITKVPADGVWTLFVTGKYRGTWGFLVNGQKVPFKEYLARF